MSETNRVVARFLDGRMLKGTTDDFFPNRPYFHIHAVGESNSQIIQCAQLKAVFFVRSLEGDPRREDVPGFGAQPAEASKGRKIVVQFRDGEVLNGFTLAYTPDRSGFFVVPADTGSNNLRAYIFKAATKKIAVGIAADAPVSPPDSAAA